METDRPRNTGLSLFGSWDEAFAAFLLCLMRRGLYQAIRPIDAGTLLRDKR